jgi:hypothetical protein
MGHPDRDYWADQSCDKAAMTSANFETANPGAANKFIVDKSFPLASGGLGGFILVGQPNALICVE